MFAWLKNRRRAAIRRRPFPPEWRALIAKNVPLVARLPPSDREELVGHVQVFLAEKRFEGCGGLEITDEVRVTIAAQACILLLHRETDYYPDLVSILVYPTTYVGHEQRRNPDGVVAEGPQARLGESWARDVVVLAWDSVLSGAADIHDGHNVGSLPRRPLRESGRRFSRSKVTGTAGRHMISGSICAQASSLWH